MRLGAETNGRSNELAMQSEFEKWISDHNKHWHRQGRNRRRRAKS